MNNKIQKLQKKYKRGKTDPEVYKLEQKGLKAKYKDTLSSIYDGIVDRIFEIQEQEGYFNVIKQMGVYARLISYSHNNQMIIHNHYEKLGITPKVVRGAKAWWRAGRHVIKGSSGAQIYIPILRKYTDTDDDGIDTEYKYMSFKVGNVFDYSQTAPRWNYKGEVFDISQADLLPDFRIQNLYRVDTLKLMYALLNVAEDLGFTVRTDSLGLEKRGLNGFIHSKHIVLDDNLRGEEFAHVLVHEIAHGLCEHQVDKTVTAIAELEAEMVAGVVHSVIGLEVRDSSSYYLSLKKKYARDDFKKSLPKVMKAVNVILKELEKVGDKTIGELMSNLTPTSTIEKKRS